MLCLLLLMLLSFCSHSKTPKAIHFLVHSFTESRQWLDRFTTSEPLDWMPGDTSYPESGPEEEREQDTLEPSAICPQNHL